MHASLVVHVVAGSVALLAGYAALYATKGAPFHRRSGTVFVCAMLVMSFLGVMIAAVRSVAPSVNIPAGVLTAYMVITGLIAVRPLPARVRTLELLLMVIALVVGLTTLGFALEAVASPTGKGRDGMPSFPFFLFGIVGTLAGVLDFHVIRAGGLTGAARVARHLWRMSFALFIAALSFFLGQADKFPKAVRIMPLLVLPVVAVLVTMLYWLWRVRLRRRMSGLVTLAAPKAA